MRARKPYEVQRHRRKRAQPKRQDISKSLTSETSRAEAQSVLKRRANQHKKNPTQAETAMQKILDNLGVRYVFQSIHLAGGHYRIYDFYLPKRRTFIEIDGETHDPRIDYIKDQFVLNVKKRFRILRYTNREVVRTPIYVSQSLRHILS